MEIRKAGKEDVGRLVDLWMEMMREHQTFEPRIILTPLARMGYRNYLELHLRSDKSTVRLIHDTAGAHGFCCAYVCQNLPMFQPSQFGYISDIYIEPPFRGQGHGERLLETIRDDLRQLGARDIQLQVYRANAVGQKFWKEQGFTPFFDRMWMSLDNDPDS